MFRIACRSLKRLLPIAGLVLLSGAVRAGTTIIDPDTASDGQNISAFYTAQGVTLSHTPDMAAVDDDVYALSSTFAGGNVFAWNVATSVPSGSPSPPLGADDHWARGFSPDLVATLNFQVQYASIQVWTDFGATMTAYDTSNNVLGATSILGDLNGFQTLDYSSTGNDIAKVMISLDKTPGADFGLLDHLVLTTAGTQPVPEPGSMALLAIGGLPFAGLLRRRRAAR